MQASQQFAKKLGEVVIRPELNGLKKDIPLDAQAKVTDAPQGDLIRWLWNGILYSDDKLSVRLTLGCQQDAMMKAKVRAYYDKAFASAEKEAPGERNCQEVYTGKTRNFTIEGDSEAAFSIWFKDELHECTAALQRQT